MNKRFLLVSLMACFLLSSCSSKQPKENNSVKDIPLATLVKGMSTTATALPTMDSLSMSDKDAKEWFEYLCDLDYSKVEDFLISYSNQTTADEFFIIRLKEERDLDTAKDSLEKRIETRRLAFQNYLPIQVNKIDSAQIISAGPYIALIICNNPDDVCEIFTQTFSH